MAADLWRLADETAEIVEVQPPGHQVRLEQRACAADAHGCIAAQVAVANIAAEAAIAPGAADRILDIARESTIQRIWRCVRGRHANQRIQVGKIASGQGEFQVHVAEAQRIEQRAARVSLGGAGACLQVDAVRTFAVTQFKRRFRRAR